MAARTQDKSVTLEDIARRARCSCNTVSLALRDSPRISAPTRDRIRRIARRLNYVPNRAARVLRRRRSGIIGIYTHALHDAVRTELVNRLLDELHTAEYQPVLGLGATKDQPWHESSWMETFRDLRVEALVLITPVIHSLPAWCRHLPIIALGCQPSESLPCDYLALDRTEGARLAVEHLQSRGHRRILVCSAGRSEFTLGCLEAAEARGLQARLCAWWPSVADLERARAVGFTLAREGPGASAAIFGDAGQAAAFMRGFSDAGGQVPKDLAMISYDFFPWADMLAVPLSTVEQPIGGMVSAAVDLIQRRLGEPEARPMHWTQPHILRIRKST